MKLTLIIAGLLILILGAAELALRVFLGFGKPPLYVADTQTGYRLAPNQRTKRFGNVFEINQYSMRGDVIAPQPTPDTLRILLLGDSIANGGWWTDQSKILSQRLQQQLTATLSGPYTQVEVLNASANSWGPRNELAYALKFGTFDSQVVVLLLNTDDLFATAPTSVQVGRDRAYPQRYPPLALVEVAGRFLKSPAIPELEAVRQEGGDRVGVNLEAVRQLKQLTDQADGRLILAMTPLLREVQPPGSRDYEIVARQRVTQFAELEQIPYIDFLADFQATANPDALYRDHIHLSAQGYALVTQTLSGAVTQIMQTTTGATLRLPDTLLEDPW
ncbi:SGNH/GDSL hydrolase family protein [Leptolyngbya iicbica]|uniref:SGNH/GDSL hydrolase family protein n=2 Tax=Cyanophyceae TaxID=3028117 RepID=A0A4Q7E6U4_9CYAN|nr:SGNH/GDSL hydrolase family protein [Leptolyngbya sp. LK]RZM77943.1 SGNH/GDSL hydrolase family protein [Leptolyngbya sp. LK]